MSDYALVLERGIVEKHILYFLNITTEFIYPYFKDVPLRFKLQMVLQNRVPFFYQIFLFRRN